ncbi:heterokaryon incompatibility protein-domain-containing protein, partial [Hyaloscypha sp. PMI_1271]
MPGIFTSRPVANDSSSEACFKMARYWLKTCLETHYSLCQVQGSLSLPTRVLDVGLLESPFVNLYISNGRHGQWLTLSHCWGKTQPATTTKGNLNNHSTKIIISTLPQTFRDAILITRKLGYLFLWIDSLCIVQDSLIDWQEESVKMNTIYSNAVLNISADAAADSFQGIFFSSNRKIDGRIPSFPPPRPDLIRIPVHSPKTGLKSTLFANGWRLHYNGFLNNDPLQERGWVLAEAVLSRRRLRYTSSGLAWSCAQVPTFCEETRPHQIHDLVEQEAYIHSVYQIPYESLPPRYVHEPETGGRRWEIIDWWYERVSDYINRQLTFQHDKFPAFSGIAKTYSDRTGYSYKAGILVEDFRRGLLWQTCGRPVDIEVAPSWSWAVVGHGGITYPRIYEWIYAHQTYVADPNEVELIDICVTNLHDDPFGQVISGSLTLRG